MPPRLPPPRPLPMNYDHATVELVRQALIITLKIAAPVLVAGILVGLVISIFQSITSIQDQTLATVPKIVVMVVVAVILASWIAQRLIEYAAALFNVAGPYV
ncbi:MAG TPA: flagellar biosynthetic protein FliQ [Phycisphaerales bacterium]|nr:flagellar biosynthetic protein FliQ [Phycisphaerales bacterium]